MLSKCNKMVKRGLMSESRPCIRKHGHASRCTPNLLGLRIGRVVVVSQAGDYITSSGAHSIRWNVENETGGIVATISSALLAGRHFGKRKNRSYPKISIGQKFHKLTVVERADAPSKSASTNSFWLCECSCSAQTRVVVCGSQLNRGHSKSCGCLREERTVTHGHARQRPTPTYRTWVGMHDRCENPNSEAFRFYGARGIRVSPRWSGQGGFVRFLEDMGERPEGTSLGRFLDSGNYERGNVVWQTDIEQKAEQKGKRAMRRLNAMHIASQQAA